MRPIKLIMSAFGPYAGKVELDMEKLGDRGIYLVTGDTGAGKTTIFDAICYALYGEASGEIRTNDLFRSKYAKDETPTYVEMEFLYRNELYKVKRNPEYMRPAMKGEARLVPEDAKAYLEYPDGRVVTKIKEVTDAITELLGLNRDQFTQIAMIAQGDFLKLIMARTEERKAIFREIFKTKAYDDLQERLKKNSGALGKKYEDLSKGVSQYISGIMLEETDPEYEELIDIKKRASKGKNTPSITEVLDRLEHNLILDNNNLKEMNKRVKEYEKSLNEVNNKIVKVENILKLNLNLEDATKKLEDGKEKLDILAKVYKEEESKGHRRENLAIELAGEEDKLNKISKYNDALKHKEELTKQIKQLELKENDVYKKKDELEKVIKETKLYLEENNEETYRAQVDIINTQKQELNARHIALSSIKKKYNEYVSEYDKYNKSLVDYNCLKDKYKDICEEYLKAEMKFFDEQAGIIASKLEENRPCPVCGSTTHPKKASLSPESITKEILDTLKKKRQDAESNYNKASELSGRLKGSLESIVSGIIFDDDIKDDIQNIESKDIIDEVVNIENINCEALIEDIRQVICKKDQVLEKDIEELKQEDKALSIKDRERKEKQKQLEEYREKVQNIKDNIVKINEDKLRATSAYDNEITSIEELSKILDNTDIELEKKIYNEKKVLKDTLDKQYNIAKKEYEEHKVNLGVLEGNVNALKKQLKDSGKVTENKDELVIKAKDIKVSLEKVRKDKENLLIKMHTNEDIYSNIERKHNEIEEVESQWNMVKALSNTAAGNVSGKKKILLETYVQMAYFDRIITRANSRLMRMSSGQYELIRKEDVKDSRSQIGLELDVIDHYNGTKRSVKSLSGGEAFKASLALALGLSDEIQSLSGGIQLDTMFIDEGFGSLDEESLDGAIKTLYDLGKGNRLIGIISHVNELKTRIDRQIIVTKTRDGSYLDLV